MQKMGAMSANVDNGASPSADAGDIPAAAATPSDVRSNDEKHMSLLKGAGEAHIRTREELTHRTPEPPSDEKARKRTMVLGLALAAVVVIVVLVLLVLLGANSAL